MQDDLANRSEALISWHDAVTHLRSQPESAQLVKDCYFDDPVLAAAQRFYASAEYIASRPFFPEKVGRVLDVGAGRGILSYALARDGWSVTALEPDPSDLVGRGAILQLAADSGLAIEIVDRKGEQIPFSDSYFDFVYCRQVLHHAQNLPAFCKEVARVLKPGGVMIATREHVVDRPQDLPRFLKMHPLHHLYGGEHAYERHVYEGAIRDAGLDLEITLNPYQSDINLFPLTAEVVQRKIVRKFGLPSQFASLVPASVIKFFGDRLRTPGRLYTFVARKEN